MPYSESQRMRVARVPAIPKTVSRMADARAGRLRAMRDVMPLGEDFRSGPRHASMPRLVPRRKTPGERWKMKENQDWVTKAARVAKPPRIRASPGSGGRSRGRKTVPRMLWSRKAMSSRTIKAAPMMP